MQSFSYKTLSFPPLVFVLSATRWGLNDGLIIPLCLQLLAKDEKTKKADVQDGQDQNEQKEQKEQKPADPLKVTPELIFTF